MTTRRIEVHLAPHLGTELIQHAVPWCAEHDDRMVIPGECSRDDYCYRYLKGFGKAFSVCALEDPPQHWIDV